MDKKYNSSRRKKLFLPEYSLKKKLKNMKTYISSRSKLKFASIEKKIASYNKL